MPRKVFTAGEVLAAADVNTYLMDQTIMTFAGTAARGSAIGSATEGMVTYLADTDSFEFWNGSSYESFGGAVQIAVKSLVIAGGGGGGSAVGGFCGGGGGGAGGYRNSDGTSGGNSVAEAAFDVTPEINYLVTVGAGGAQNTNGANSVFANILSYGGCKGGPSSPTNGLPGVGGSGGGGGGQATHPNTGFAVSFQGINGSTGYLNSAANQGGGGGGGGASATGGAAGLAAGGTGGAGLASTITGSSITRAGGGGGGAGNNTTFAAGGAGGGGNGGASTGGAPTAGTVNTGGGGGGGANFGGATAGAAGGSGVVFLKYADTEADLVVGSGLVIDTSGGGSTSGSGTRLAPSFTPSGFKVYMFKSGSGNVSW
jgi:hypothetical protein